MISDETSPIVQDQMNRPDVDVFTGKTFGGREETTELLETFYQLSHFR